MLHLLLVAFAAGSLAPVARFQDPAPPPAPAPVRALVRGTRVRLAAQPGHEPGRGFLGYSWPETNASLIVLEMPGPYAEVVQGFDKNAIERGGMKLIEREETKVCGRDGLLVYASQEANAQPYRKWVALCGEGQRSVLLNAVYPAEHEAELKPLFRAVLLAAEWDPTLEVDPFAILPWTIATPEGLRFGGAVGQTLMYTLTGELSREKGRGAEPVMIVSPSMGEAQVKEARTFAELRVRQLPGLQKLEILRSEPFEAGGRAGWEVTAKALHAQDQIEVCVYQVMLVGPGEYWLAVGTVGFDQADPWVPRFRSSARSWKLKAEPAPTPKPPDGPAPKPPPKPQPKPQPKDEPAPK